jgi:hypothetical protein
MADAVVHELVFAMMQAEQARLPFDHQSSLHVLAETAEPLKTIVLEQQGRKGGRSQKTDVLQRIIIEIVRKRPRITAAQLQHILTREYYPHVIEDVDEESIHFTQPDGTKAGKSKEAPISGLKDRLSRAKRTLKIAPTG